MNSMMRWSHLVGHLQHVQCDVPGLFLFSTSVNEELLSSVLNCTMAEEMRMLLS